MSDPDTDETKTPIRWIRLVIILYIVISYPANVGLMKCGTSFYEPPYYVSTRQGGPFSQEHDMTQDEIATRRSWQLVLSPVVLPISAIYSLASWTVD